MKIDHPLDDPTEALMSDTTTTLRYGYQPSAAFAATRAGAARRADQAAAAATQTSVDRGHGSSLLHRLAAPLAALAGRLG